MKVKLMPLSIPLFVSLTLFSGCTPYSETFDCPSGVGVGCKSLSQVNQMVEDGKLPVQALPTQRGPLKKTDENPSSDFPSLIEASLETNSGNKTLQAVPHEIKPLALLNQHNFSKADPRREPRPETYLKIWRRGFEDENQNYHAPSYIYAALRDDSTPEPHRGK